MMPSSASSTQSAARQAAVLRAVRAQARRTAPLRGARFDGGSTKTVTMDDEEQDDDVTISDDGDDESFDDSAEGEDGGTGATEEDTDESKGEDETEEKEGEKEKGEREGEEKEGKEESDKKDGEEGKEKSGDEKDERKSESKEPTPSDKAAEPSPQGAAPSREQRAAELATAHAQARRQQVSGVPEAAAPTQNERGERMAPSAATQDRQAREQSAQARGESRGGKIAEARAKLGAAKEAYEGFNAMLDELRKLGDVFRSRLDQTFLASIFAFPMGTLLATALLHARVLASTPGMRKTRFGFFRFTANNVFEMLPNSKKMRPFTFTPITGFITAGIIDSGIAVALLINFIITFFPYIATAIGIGFLFDAGMRELMLSLVGF